MTTRVRFVVQEVKAGFIGRFQRRRRFWWQTIHSTLPSKTFQGCLGEAGQLFTQTESRGLGVAVPRHERRQAARELARMLK